MLSPSSNTVPPTETSLRTDSTSQVVHTVYNSVTSALLYAQRALKQSSELTRRAGVLRYSVEGLDAISPIGQAITEIRLRRSAELLDEARQLSLNADSMVGIADDLTVYFSNLIAYRERQIQLKEQQLRVDCEHQAQQQEERRERRERKRRQKEERSRRQPKGHRERSISPRARPLPRHKHSTYRHRE